MLVWGFEGRSKSESGGSACCCWDRLGSSVTTRLKDAPSPPRDAIAAPLNKYRGTPPSMKTLRGRQGGRRPAFCVQRNRRVKGEWASGRAGKQMARGGRGEEGGWCKKGSRQRQYLGHKMSGNTRQRRCLTAGARGLVSTSGRWQGMAGQAGFCRAEQRLKRSEHTHTHTHTRGEALKTSGTTRQQKARVFRTAGARGWSA